VDMGVHAIDTVRYILGYETPEPAFDRKIMIIPIVTRINPAPKLVILPTKVSVNNIETSTIVPKKQMNSPKALFICPILFCAWSFSVSSFCFSIVKTAKILSMSQISSPAHQSTII